ncbi:hypothetical protein LDENG_00216630 [Lucifuga dentata]|nr:hypothetical protein LDENG_00216630 [Lucifuga dentata]
MRFLEHGWPGHVERASSTAPFDWGKSGLQSQSSGKKLQPRLVSRDFAAYDVKAKAAYKFSYDRRHSARPLPALRPGDGVLLKLDGEKGWRTPSTVVSTVKEPRSYLVQTQDGNVLRRNRRHLQPVPVSAPQQEHHTDCSQPLKLEEPSTPPNPSPAYNSSHKTHYRVQNHYKQ